MSDTRMIQEMQNLSMFLATQNKIKDALKSELQLVGFIVFLVHVDWFKCSLAECCVIL